MGRGKEEGEEYEEEGRGDEYRRGKKEEKRMKVRGGEEKGKGEKGRKMGRSMRRREREKKGSKEGRRERERERRKQLLKALFSFHQQSSPRPCPSAWVSYPEHSPLRISNGDQKSDPRSVK